MLEIIRERSKDVSNEAGEIIISKEEWPEFRLRIESENNFPTAAGLASSASGFACMTAALTALYNVQENYPGEFSLFARQGSGSACRSMYGGFAKWIKGENADGSDSIALQVSNDNHWDDMRVLILVANSGPKEIGSTEGMQRSVVTSPLLKFRADHLVDERMHVMEKAILEKDFETFAKLTMQDSNQFHAVCMDTYPPVFYLNDTSKAIIQLVHQINEQAGFSKAAYTFDAGPNAVIFTLKEHLSEVMSTILRMTPEGLSVYDPMNLVEENSFNAHGKDDLKSGKPVLHGVEKVMVTKGGPGPKVSWSCQ